MSYLPKSYDEEIIERNKIWAENVNKYTNDKKNLEWGYNKSPKYVTEKIIKERDCIFNPVTQTYKDKELDNNLRLEDQKTMKDIITKNYDRSLCYEQTYNLINRDDKLKVFKNHQDYPTTKSDPIRTKLEKQRINHNIISNYTLDKHNYCKPELRPKVEKEPEKERNKINVNLYRDFDVISNKYKVEDGNKAVADKQIAQYEAAKKFWNTHDYNLIQADFYDKEKSQKMKGVPDFETCKKHFIEKER